MSSKISYIFDRLITEMQDALKEHQELLDFEDLENNAPAILAKGFGIGVGAGRNTERCFDGLSYYYEREFVLIITRSALTTYADAQTRKDQIKTILEDLDLVMKGLTGDFTFVDTDGTEKSFNVKFANDGGPKSTVIVGEKYQFIELTVTAEYRETVGG